MADPQTIAKKYCLNCFQVMIAAEMVCPHCKYPQPTSFNHTYLQPPFRLKEQYILGRVLGHGGFAITYLGYDRSLGTRVAIKEYFPAEFATRAADGCAVIPYAGNRQTLFQLGKEKFIAEARLLATLRNPNIIGIRQFVEDCNTAYFVMEYLEGQDLRHYVEKMGGQLSWAEVKELLWPLLGALEELHLKQCFHRDIKPDNIYITTQLQPILLDFGAARQQVTGATTNLLAFLTPGFAPAEQYSINGIQGPWTDIYALAATMYYATTGQVPPVPQDRVLGDVELIPPSQLGVDISSEDEAWLLKGLEVKWSSRPENVAEWRRLLDAQKQRFIHTVELSGDELKKEMEMAFLRSAILPRLMSRFLTPVSEREIHEAATFVGLKKEQVDELIGRALLMTGSERRDPDLKPPKQVAPKIENPREKVSRPDISSWSTKPASSQVQEKTPSKQQKSQAKIKDTSALPPHIRNSLGMEFVLIKPFEINGDDVQYQFFNMGTQQRPYRVKISQPYYLQTTQITQGQWRVVMGHNPAHFQGDDWQPIENISWDDISPFLQRLNMLNEGCYRLPTEAEWEFACRAGTEGLYAFGNDEGLLAQYAWYDATANGRTHAVGMKKSNHWGLYDMHGNVWEWVADRFAVFPEGEHTDPRGPDRGNSRVMRGGSWNLGPNYCKTVSRNYEQASYKANNLGLRLLLEV